MMMMLQNDKLTASSGDCNVWPPSSMIMQPPNPSYIQVQPSPEYNNYGDVSREQSQGQQSAKVSEQAYRLSKAEDAYFGQFLSILEEEVENNAHFPSPTKKQQTGKNRKSVPAKNKQILPYQGPRFHACACVKCVQPKGSGKAWRILPDCIAITLPHSGLHIELLSCGAIHITGPYLGLFISAHNENPSSNGKLQSPKAVLTFHGTGKVLLRSSTFSERARGQQQGPQNEVNIVSGPYSVYLRPTYSSFTSMANLLTYVVDKGGTKTKVCKTISIGDRQEEGDGHRAVLQAVKQELTSARAKWREEVKMRALPKKKVQQGGVNKEKMETSNGNGRHQNRQEYRLSVNKEQQIKYKRKWYIPTVANGNNNFWTFEDGLTIHDQPDGTLQVYYKTAKNKNAQSDKLQLLINWQHLYLKLNQQCIILDKTGHLFVGSHLPVLQEKAIISVASPFENGNPQQTLSKVCTDIGLTTAHTFALHENSHGQGSSKGKKMPTLSLPSEHQKNEKMGKKSKPGNGNQLSLSGLLSSYDQYAMSSPGSPGSGNGLLVKHNRYRQAGLNERNLICLF